MKKFFHLGLIPVFLFSFILCSLIWYPQKAQADIIDNAVPQNVNVLPTGATLEQMLRSSQMLLTFNDTFDQLTQNTNQNLAYAKMFAAFTGNKKLIELANANPISVIQNSVNGWMKDFSQSLADKIQGWFKTNTTKNTIAEFNLTEQQGKDADLASTSDLGIPASNDPQRHDTEQMLRNNYVYQFDNFQKLGQYIRFNYDNQQIDPKKKTVTKYSTTKYPDDSMPDYISKHQVYLAQIANDFGSSNPQDDTMLAQLKLSNELLLEQAQTNIRILQALNDLIKIQYQNSSVETAQYLKEIETDIQSRN